VGVKEERWKGVDMFCVCYGEGLQIAIPKNKQ